MSDLAISDAWFRRAEGIRCSGSRPYIRVAGIAFGAYRNPTCGNHWLRPRVRKKACLSVQIRSRSECVGASGRSRLAL